MLRKGIKHQDYFPSDPKFCPCDACVLQTELEHMERVRNVWNSRRAFTIKELTPGRNSQGANLRPCIICGDRISYERGMATEVNFYSYSPYLSSDTIPFPHVKKALIHNLCVPIALTQDPSLPLDGKSNYYKHFMDLVFNDPGFAPRLARAVGYVIPKEESDSDLDLDSESESDPILDFDFNDDDDDAVVANNNMDDEGGEE